MTDRVEKPSEPGTQEDESKPTRDTEINEDRGQPTRNDNDTGLDDQNLDEILTTLRDNEFLSSLISERDVSLVYIDRHRVQNFFGAEGKPVRRHAAGVGPPQRLHDLVVNLIPPFEVEQLQRVYVEPLLYPDALARFREQGLLILCGPRQTGKRATALRMLSQIRGADGRPLPLYELNPDQSLSDIQAEDLPADAGLLLESPSGEALTGLSAFQMTALRSRLGPQVNNNGLVIVVEQLPTGFPRDQRNFVFDWSLTWPGDAAEARRTLLANHLLEFSRYESNMPEQIGRAIESLISDDRLKGVLDHNLGPGELADLALILLSVLQGRHSLEEALARFGVQVQREVAEWFASDDHDLEVKLLMIAAAVFNGALVEEVEAAQEDLLSRIHPDSDKKDEREHLVENPFSPRYSRRKRLDAIQAELREIPIPGTHYGDTSAQALVLRNEAWQQAVLYHIWTDVTPLHEPMLNWLSDFCVNRSPRLRERAAAAVGALARHSFPLIEASLLRAWAGSPDEARRRSAAQVLGITMWDEDQSAATSRLLHHWATMTDNIRYQWTAATAYAGLAGLRYPQQALSDLRRIAVNTLQEPHLLRPIFYSFLMQFAVAEKDPERRLSLLQELLSWVNHKEDLEKDRTTRRQKERAIRRTGLLTFDVLLLPERADPVWRMLVADAGAPGEAQDLTIALLLSALLFRQPKGVAQDPLHPRKMALNNIHELLLYAAEGRADEDLHHDLASLLTKLVQRCRQESPDTLEMLRYHASLWDDVRTKESTLIDILLAA